MKIQKAIEILSESAYGKSFTTGSDFTDALKLGIEALQRIVYLRKDTDCPHYMTLPGEREE